MGHTRAIRRLYPVMDIDKGYRLEMATRAGKEALKAKSNIPITLKANM